MTSPNGLICFTNCLLPQEDGSLLQKDLWIDERRGVILDAQRTFFVRKERPDKVIDLGGNILSPGLIDIQINGAYGFDFSVFEGDEDAYRQGLKHVAEKIVETGVTSLVPTIITQQRCLYPTLLNLLRPYSSPNSATLLGWHAEGPFIQLAKRGAHHPDYLLKATKGIGSFEAVYGKENLTENEDWLMTEEHTEGKGAIGVRIITAAPEIEGVLDSIGEVVKRGVVFSIGHSIASTNQATLASLSGARLITHLFNAMPQLHHRDPCIIGLIGASPYVELPRSRTNVTAPSTPALPTSPSKGSLVSRAVMSAKRAVKPARIHTHRDTGSEAIDEHHTPPMTPLLSRLDEHNHHLDTSSLPFDDLKGLTPPSIDQDSNVVSGITTPVATTTIPVIPAATREKNHLRLRKDEVVEMPFERPFYELIVDGVHSHPNSVRLAYTAYPEGCILITDAMKILDPHLQDGIHEWRDGKRFVKEGDKLYLEGTDTLAGSVVTLSKCVRNFTLFTGCTLGEAIKCATYNPAKCLGIENRKGTLRAGADADLVVLDRQGEVLQTWVGGRVVWSRE